MKKIFINAVILICVHLVIVKFVYKYFFVSEKVVEFLIDEYKNESFYFSRIQNFVVNKHQKSIAIFSISFIFISFGIYYNIIFVIYLSNHKSFGSNKSLYALLDVY